MNAARLNAAKSRLITNSYGCAWFLQYLLERDVIPEWHREQAQHLLAEHEEAAAERDAALDEPEAVNADAVAA